MYRICIFYCFLLLVLATSCPSYLLLQGSACEPCSSSCSSCSSPTACSTCGVGYYKSATSTCEPCLDNCQSCSSATTCSVCSSPYLLSSNGSSCSACLINKALTCSSNMTATSCEQGYYVQYGSCMSCLLHCSTCTNSTSCSACSAGYLLQYQNSVCTACINCKSCVSTTTNCTACWDGYTLTSNGSEYTCAANDCNIANCAFCNSSETCANCNANYYLSGNQCIFGASLLCNNGATGVKPIDCAISCASNSVATAAVGSSLYCLPSQLTSSGKINQLYYYMYNNYQAVFGASTVLSSACSGEFHVTNPPTLTLSLPYFYKVVVQFKAYALSGSSTTLSLSSGASTQSFSFAFGSQCQPTIASATSIDLRSNSLTISFTGGSLGLIQLLVSAYKCSSDCKSCLNTELCLVCASNLYMFDYKCISDCMQMYRLNQSSVLSCVTTCPNGFYNNKSTASSCLACPQQCSTCTNSSTCFTCATVGSVPYYYLPTNYSCVNSCPAGYYGANHVCNTCVTPCATCTSQTICTSCIFGYWNGTNCTVTCPSGKYGDDNTHQCQTCHSSCLTCILNSQYCLSCQAPLILFENSCLSQCRDGYFKDSTGTSCNRCIPPCKNCNNLTSCLSCAFGYLDGTSCTNNCPSGTYANTSTFQCVSCPAICQTCSSASFCTDCLSGYCLQQGQCIASSSGCITTYYPLTLSGKCYCTSCSFPCKTCTSQDICTSCISGYLFSNYCQSSCPDGYAAFDSNQSCLACSTLFRNCTTCQLLACTSCSSGFMLNPYSTSSTDACVSSCPSGTFNQSLQCVACTSPCLTCSSQTVCNSCETGYIYKNSACVTECSSGQFASGTPASCVACNSPCATCSSATVCLTCIRQQSSSAQKYFSNGSCVSTCPDYYYTQPITLQCEKCLTPCRTCAGQSYCLSCSVGFLNSATHKCESCAAGTYADNSTSTCKSCSNNCNLCTDASTCYHCTNSYYLYQGSCISASACSVISGYYLQTATFNCAPCISPCRTCSSETACLTCQTGYLYYSNSCSVSCPKGFFGNQTSGLCAACSSECAECSGSSTTCLKCATGYYYSLNTRRCLTQCPANTYLRGSSCLDCKYPCLDCTSESLCTTCITGAVFQGNGSCLSTCPSSYFATNVSYTKCDACNSNCLQCFGQPANCTKCASGLRLFNNTCLTLCPNGYFADDQVNSCFTCISPCLYCTDQVTCTKCSDQFYYLADQNQCVGACPSGYFPALNPNTGASDSKYYCLTCLPQCLTCDSPTACLLCKSGVQYNGKCVDACPSGLYSKQGTCFECSLPCRECTSTDTCTACPLAGGYLLVGQSQCIQASSCPSGYYLIANTSICSATCPTGYYRVDLTRTCQSVCPPDYFKGQDYKCYTSCPSGQIANSSYYCIDCSGSQCENVLNFAISTEIIWNRLYMYLTFTKEPIFAHSLSEPYIQLVPPMAFTITKSEKIVELLLDPSTSQPPTYLKVRFLSPFQLFSNTLPLQNPQHYYKFKGYDKYSESLSFLQWLGTLLGMFCFLSTFAYGYFGLDFVQNVFLYQIVNVHYPTQLASFLQGFKSSHLFVSIAQVVAPAIAKFKSATNNMSFIGNTAHLLIIILIVGILWGGLAIAVYLLDKIARSRISDASDAQTPLEQRWWHKALNIFNFEVHARCVYLSYTYIVLFAVAEIYTMSEQNPAYSQSSRLLAVLFCIVFTAYPFIILYHNPRPVLLTLLLLRKWLIAICVVVAIQYPLYVVGSMAVANTSTVILLLSYRPYVWRVQQIFYSVGEGVQAIGLCLIVLIVFVGQGSYTQAKQNVGSMLIVLISLSTVAYAVFGLMQATIAVFKLRGKDYIQEWTKQDETQSNKQLSDQNDGMSDAKPKRSETRVPTLKKVDIPDQAQYQSNKQQQAEEEVSQMPLGPAKPNKKQARANSAVFKVYSQQGDSDKGSEKQEPPQYLVKVVNKFEDFGGVAQN